LRRTPTWGRWWPRSRRSAWPDSWTAPGESGASILSGGSRPEQTGAWYSPTVVAPAGQDAEIVQREVAEMPHGGYRQSGYGKEMSLYSIEEYTNVKHVMASLE
jgi:acyl-CoA reductase-like NAD-dependent aldehyde dehydrogenase